MYNKIVMKMIDEIKNKMNSIDYGWVDRYGLSHKEDEDKNFSEDYILQAPKELLKSKTGLCWDQVELERYLFNEKGITNETYFIYIDDNASLPSHTFLVYYQNQKVYWFEHSWFDYAGTYEYNDINELLNSVKDKFIKSHKDEIKQNINIYIYKYKSPKYHIGCDEFYKYINTQEKITVSKIALRNKNDR